MSVRDYNVRFDWGPGVETTFTGRQPWASFRMYRLTTILHGRCTYCFADGDVAAEPGDMLLIQPGEREIRTDGVRVHWLPFSLHRRGRAVERVATWPQGQRYAGPSRERALMRQAHEDLTLLVHDQPTALRAELQALIILDLFDTPDAPRAAIPPGIRAATRRLSLRPGERCTVAELAANAGLSVSQFRRVFERCHGVSPVRYAIERRLEAARQMLTVGGLSVKETAPSATKLSRFGVTAAGLPRWPCTSER